MPSIELRLTNGRVTRAADAGRPPSSEEEIEETAKLQLRPKLKSKRDGELKRDGDKEQSR